ncbi:MAG: hypothetical protein ACXWM8_01230 [Candidatus Limnocylindrales bacterium]
MQHSIAARYVAWPAARFAGTGGREGERRLGLHSSLRFQRAATNRTILRPYHRGSRATGWLPATTTPGSVSRSGLVRAAVTIHWTGVGRPQADRRSSLAPAPWRG